MAIITTVFVCLCSQCKDIKDPMPVRDRVDLDCRFGAEFADGLCTTGGFRVRRLAVLP